MNRLKGQFFTRENTVEEKLDRGLHHWFSRPDITGSEDLIEVRVEVGPGEGHPFHVHPDMDEVIEMLSGRGEEWIEEDRKSRGQNSRHVPSCYAVFRWKY